MTEATTTPPLATVEELNDLRQRVLAGEEFPAEEYRRIIQAYRANRLAGVTAAAPKTKAKAAATAKAAPQDLSSLMSSLGL
jgi:hypothetical protein